LNRLGSRNATLCDQKVPNVSHETPNWQKKIVSTERTNGSSISEWAEKTEGATQSGRQPERMTAFERRGETD
jgi:hypothetical protein